MEWSPVAIDSARSAKDDMQAHRRNSAGRPALRQRMFPGRRTRSRPYVQGITGAASPRINFFSWAVRRQPASEIKSGESDQRREQKHAEKPERRLIQCNPRAIKIPATAMSAPKAITGAATRRSCVRSTSMADSSQSGPCQHCAGENPAKVSASFSIYPRSVHECDQLLHWVPASPLDGF